MTGETEMISGLTTFYRLHDGGCDYEVPVDVINYFQSRIAELEARLALAEKVCEAAFKALDGWEYDHASIAGVRTDEARRLRAELEGK